MSQPDNHHTESTISQLHAFRRLVEEKYNLDFSDYESFRRWSVDNLEEFWRTWSQESGMLFRKKRGTLGNGSLRAKELELSEILMPGKSFKETIWFPSITLNFAENLLRHTQEDPHRVAIHFQPEPGTATSRYMDNSSLYKEVANLYFYLKNLGVKKGDRLAAVLPNSPESIIGMLATSALGAVWSSASPDFGAKGIIDRFSQIQPKVLILCNGYFFKGKEISCLDKWREVWKEIPDLDGIVLWNFTRPGEDLDLTSIVPSGQNIGKIILWDSIQDNNPSGEIEFEPISFQDPVYIMYSSGTTGLPKCIVQGPGVLLNHTKELILHCDLRKNESITYYTTCGWMMWNWVASSLFVGSRLCIFDGNPFYPDGNVLWDWMEREKINVFGTSAKYISVLQQEGVIPANSQNLDYLRLILSTGSPLPESGYDYIYENVKKNVHLASISGGTDLNGCFALGNPDLPVHKGEIQCRGLGMAVKIYNENGEEIQEEKGELVCEKPFPSMPLYFWNDSDGAKYQDAYFSRFTNIWCHGDFAELTKHNGIIIYGRSDATLNPGGVRIGTADIYNVLQSIPEIEDSLIIGQNWKDDVRVILFVKWREEFKSQSSNELYSSNNLSKDWEEKIKKTIRDATSPRHVPTLVFRVQEIPYTINGKKVELAVKNIAEGNPIKNIHSLGNPSSLDEYKKIFSDLQ